MASDMLGSSVVCRKSRLGSGRKVHAKNLKCVKRRRLFLESLEDRALMAALYWDPDGNTTNNNLTTGAGLGGAGTWNTSSAGRWVDSSNNPVTWTNGNEAVFWGTSTAAKTVTVTTVSASAITLKTTGYTLGSSTLTLTSPATITTETGVSATISSVVAGSAGLSKVGTGTLTLSGTNTYAGTTSLGGGTLIASNNAALGSSAVANSTIVSDGATLDVRASIAEPLSIAGAGVGGTTGALVSGSSGSVSGAVSLAGDVSLGGTGTLTISGAVSGGFGLTKVGGGRTALNGTNTYTGITTVEGGTLQLGRRSSLYNAATASWTDGNITVNSGATQRREPFLARVKKS
ncbi:Autotransporter-associated beta strand repeat protein [Anatilimnocola aggregata]|uniref:Autotransporter-associated beta strand repeat protein n=1 Tax=Anatilimnocola aggregata TaxID=2528021 RepID=A0A517YE63_9BACT|nr:autotransporter-associated beta strand repeat-containing protein [Anatilimnocola aggregata]QDU28452.1 Autotransporter-associated beta strand repeat protein [Anatilimnocola aggregata]